MYKIDLLTVIASVLTSTITVNIMLNKFSKDIIDKINKDITNWANDMISTINKML